MTFSPVYYEVEISQIGNPAEGFLDNTPPSQYVPFPTTQAAGLAKTKANLRWTVLTWFLGENCGPVYLYNITKTGTNLHNNPPATITFTLAYDRADQVKTEDELNSVDGPFFSIALGAVFNAGTGYLPGDVLTVIGGTAVVPAQIRVLRCNQLGAIQAAEMVTPGYYTAVPANPVSVTGGNGSSATFVLTSTENPGLTGAAAVTRLCARALLYSIPSYNQEVYDPTATPPLGPPPKPAIARNPQKIESLTMIPLAASIAAAEAVITVTPIPGI
jgi:hypothetical protein